MSSSDDQVPNIVKRYSRDKRTFSPAGPVAVPTDTTATGANAPSGLTPAAKPSVSFQVIEDLIPAAAAVPPQNADPFHSLLKTNYVKPLTEKEIKEIEKKRKAEERAQKAHAKIMAKQATVHQQLSAVSAPVQDSADASSDILGKKRRQLHVRIQKYKSTFKDCKPLQELKIKRNATEQELELYLEECQSIVECSAGGSDELIIRFILDGIKYIEGTTRNSKKYNLVGLSAALQKNPDFSQCCRELYLKYGGDFHCIPPEYRIVFIVLATSYTVTTSNSHRDVLDKPVDVELLNGL
jgi:hypothetical protein